MNKRQWLINIAASLLFLIFSGCATSHQDYGEYYNGQFCAKTPIGRLFVTQICSLDFVKEGAETDSKLKTKLDNMKDLPSPIYPGVVVPEDPDEYYRIMDLLISRYYVFPSLKQLHEIENLYRPDDLLAYCGGPDKGWFIIRGGEVIAVWQTDHAF